MLETDQYLLALFSLTVGTDIIVSGENSMKTCPLDGFGKVVALDTKPGKADGFQREREKPAKTH